MHEYGRSTAPVEGCSQVRGIIERALAEAQLDGFLAAYFLDRYDGEDRRIELSTALTELQDNYAFTRVNVAMLGIGLERGWIPPTPALLAHFADGYERLERQQPGQGLTFRESLKLLWGVTLGTMAPTVATTRPDLPARLVAILTEFRNAVRNRPRDYVLATALLVDLQPTGRETVARDLAYYLLSLKVDQLADRDALATLWVLQRDCFAPSLPLASKTDLRMLKDRLLPRLFRLGHVEDILDALLADCLYTQFIRGLSAGGGLARDGLSVVLGTLDAFPELARRLRDRKQNRPPFLVENEYDVQDLLYVALKAHLPDLSDEEWTPKDAGRAKRIDFVSRAARLCLEAKMPRDAEHARRIADELKIDIESYYVHEACDTLVVFTYDPDRHLADANQQEAQLSGLRTIKGRNVEVLVRIRPR